MAGRIALRLIVTADSPEEVDRLVLTLPLWPVAKTRLTALITFAERREHVQELLEALSTT